MEEIVSVFSIFSSECTLGYNGVHAEYRLSERFKFVISLAMERLLKGSMLNPFNPLTYEQSWSALKSIRYVYF